jgi:mono/diheme cytochrome c family protein
MNLSVRRLPLWALFLVSAAACGGGSVPLPDVAPSLIGDTAGLVARGEYIVRNVAVCGHCHASQPRDPDGPLSGGFEFKDWRLGTIRAANITSDSATGIGAWTDAEIMRAIRSGLDRDGDLLAPVMPYEWFNGMSDRDALAIARYLKSLPPARKRVESDGNIVFGIAKALVLKPQWVSGPQQAPARAATAEYGKYLAHHVALCADCHSPRGGIANATDYNRLFAGNDDPPKGFPAKPLNLTPDSASGIGKWSEAEFLRTIETGINPAGDTLHTFMPWQQFRRMSEDDLRAIYRYLRTVAPIRTEASATHHDH